MATSNDKNRAFRFGAKKLDTGTFTVINTTKRKVVRAGHVFPGLRAGKPVPVEVEITSPGVHFQLRACKALELKKGKAPKAKPSEPDPDDGDS